MSVGIGVLGLIAASLLPAGSMSGVTPIDNLSIVFNSSQCGYLLLRSNVTGTRITDVLPGANGTGILPNGCEITITNTDPKSIYSVYTANSTGTVQLNGSAANFILAGPSQSIRIVSDGMNYWTVEKPDRAKFVLNSSPTLYVCASTGSDTKSGLHNDVPSAPSGPLQTLQGVLNYYLTRFDHSGARLTIQACAGTYAGIWVAGRDVGHLMVPGGPPSTPISILLPGDPANPQNYIID